ncbi:hypothetical protein F5B22DRAFT_638361 [Xylaria bambusicola]|uniref:uncharacterized protein n=1 Tax=Xylaria bambusicola TaxID=326684 RepID=UPI0020075629|nr:uncharacterized protein F5B22DRAFT_638361 [Xylaria bambusicola]KAI0508983.1 hypothetical protein F5B22DRAFT_638361 [Xylaria bambusicola]
MAILPPKTSITSKEWVIPPRPKPGRKPATDTPPTKRKAQNRAAQRAFRERRAARVGELEEELEEQREEHERVQQQLHQRIEALSGEVDSLQSQCGILKDNLEKERAERLAVTRELESLRRHWQNGASSISSSRNGSFMSQHGRLPSVSSQHHASRGSFTANVLGHRNSASAFSIPQMISPPESSDHPQGVSDVIGCGNCSSTGTCSCVDSVLANTTVECGKCSIGTRCECLEAALSTPITSVEAELKRKHSSIAELAPLEKRQKSESYPNEIDFTAMFSSKKKVVVAEPPSEEPLPMTQPPLQAKEPCGFCTEGSYCVCAETAVIQTLPPMNQQVETPPPSEDDVGPHPMEVTSTGAIKLPSLKTLKRNSFQPTRKPTGCGANGPGTCSQCLRDPKSGLFCRSLAATFARESGSATGGCCGGSGGSGCCKSAKPPAQTSNPAAGVSLSCADAYQTLSSHPGFERASDEIETWLPKLRAVPAPGSTLGRTALDVETASIMGVLKEFDVRFGRNK